MAARENQGLQIALILSVMLAVVLAVTTYIYYRKAEEKVKEAQAASDSAKTASALAAANEAATELLMRTVGASTKNAAELDRYRGTLKASALPNKDEIAKIEAKFEADMQNFAADYPADKNKDYTTLPDYLLTVINNKSEAISLARADEARAQLAKAEAEKRDAAKLKSAEDDKQLAFVERDKSKTDFETERTRFLTDTEGLGKSVKEKNHELKAKSDVAAKEKQELTQTVDKLGGLVLGLQEKINDAREESFETPDGHLKWVNQKTNVAWIDLGSADGLRRQITFSIFDKDETNLKKADAKGSIEVTRIIDEHLAECRIVASSVSNPLLPGDLAFSPVWHPGQTLSFALAGFIDYNNDGKSDRALVKSLIQMNGGRIDAEVGDDGKFEGELSVDTRFLVVGKAPDEKSSKDSQDSFTGIQRQAQTMGVEQIAVSKFLDMMGYKGEVNTVGLGKGASGDDFKAKSADGVIRKSDGPTATFKKRDPPPRGKNGAF